MNASQTLDVLSAIRDAYPNQPMSQSTVKLWTEAMADMDYDTTRKVAYDWIMEEEWPPTIAAIRKRVLNATTSLPTATEAWMMVQERIRSTYPGHPAGDWDVPDIIQDTVRELGGIREIRMTERPDDMRKRFERAYNDRREHALKEQTLGKLMSQAMKELK